MSLGVSLEFFWGDITPSHYQKIVEAHQVQMEEKLMLLDQSNFLLGKYIAVAVGGVLSGKDHYPKEPFITTAKKRNERFKRVFSKEEIERMLAKQEKGSQ